MSPNKDESTGWSDLAGSFPEADDRFDLDGDDSISFEEFKSPSREPRRTDTTPMKPMRKPDLEGRQDDEHSDPFIGATVGNYLVLSRLGMGGFGTVYKARDVRLERLAAIKFLHYPRDPEFKRRFEREARVLANLSKHPNIVQIYAWGEYCGESYFALEHLDYSADSLLKRSPKGLPLLRVLEIGRDCARGLGHAHASSVMHRDIKPGNILIDDSTGQAKLCDFGLAISYGPGDERSASIIAGSPAYMSPEQIAGDPVDERSDIYSLGVALFRLLCGELPYKAKTNAEIFDCIQKQKRRSLQALRPELSTAVTSIIEHCIENKPADRYQTAHDLENDLRAALDALHGSGSLLQTAAAHQKRRRLAWVGTGAVTLVLCVLILVAARFQSLGDRQATAGPAFDMAGGARAVGPPSTIDEYQAMLASRQVDPERGESIRKQIANVRSAMERLENAAPPGGTDSWTTRPVRLRISPATPGRSAFAVESGLVDVMPEMLADAIAATQSYPVEIVDREFLGDVLYEQQLAELSQEMDRVRLGKLLGATHMVELEFERLFNEDSLRIKIIETETSQIAQVESIPIDANVNAKQWVADAARQLLEELRRTFPLRGRLVVQNGQPQITIGRLTGVRPDMVFRVMTGPSITHELENVTAQVIGPVRQGSSDVTIQGASIEAVPDEGWFVESRSEL